VVSVTLISVLNIKVTCEWHTAIKLNYKSTRTTVVFVLRFPRNLHRPQLFRYLAKVTALRCQLAVSRCRACAVDKYGVTDGVQYVDTPEAHTFDGHNLRNRSTLDIGVLGYIGIVQHKEHSPEVLSIPPGTTWKLNIVKFSCTYPW